MTLFDELLEAWRYTREGVIAEFENLPVDSWTRFPAGLKRTPLDLANHIIESGWLMAGELSRADGDFQRMPYDDLIADHYAGPAVSRDEALTQLRSGYERGVALLREAGDAHMNRPIRQFNGVYASRMSWMHHGIAHEEYHRGQAALYARLFGVVPALTKAMHGDAATAAGTEASVTMPSG